MIGPQMQAWDRILSLSAGEDLKCKQGIRILSLSAGEDLKCKQGGPYLELICKRGHYIQIKLRAVVTTAPDFDTTW